MFFIEYVIYVIIGIVGIAFGYMMRKQTAEREIGSAESHAKNLMIDAERESESIKKEALLEAKEEIHKMRSEAEEESKKRREENSEHEKRLANKEDQLDKKATNLERKDQSLTDRIKQLEEKETKIEDLLGQRISELERISGYSSQQAKEVLLEELKDEVVHESAAIIKEYENKTKEESEKIAKNLIANAVQKVSADYIPELTVTAVSLPNDDMKGRIIGREGRNIRTIESLTGVDLIIDDTPEAVTISSFDPVRREVARLALEKLITDGRIHPTRIEEVVERAGKEVEQSIKDAGDDAVFELGIHDIHPEIKRTLGKLKYRTSYGQNALRHSIEVAQISALIADQLGTDVRMAKRAGLLHDLGKAIDHEFEATHVALGVDLAKRYKEPSPVIDAIESHHGDKEPTYLEAIIVQAADALSAARPGARRETLQSYIKRLEKLEEIANSFEGIEKAFAVQAGREVRIVVKPENISESEMIVLSRDIAKRIENEMEYPGQIKVNIIRETRAIEYAK
ncbi:MAG: ribonuclease Y [Tissierellia bacterium]|nr:ribonuclease Y [Tissierellia bacterium]